MINAFGGILENLVDGAKYDSLPPSGLSGKIASVPIEALDSIDQDIWGQDEKEGFGHQEIDNSIKVVEPFTRKKVDIPSISELDDTNVIGISSDNARIITTSFHLILSRTSIINFRYSKGYEKPYFYTKSSDSSAIMVLDNNIFESTYSIHTYNELPEKTKVPIFDHFKKNKDNKPFRFKYNYEQSKKAPSSQSLGLAVKFQHTLELVNLNEIDFNQSGLTVCIKDGAMFSNSTELSDITNGLKKLISWRRKNRYYIALSTKVSESRVLIKTLIACPELIEEFFPGQNMTIGIISSFGTDTLLLKKILIPGFRTPLIEYIESTRKGAIARPELEGLMPVTCYYHKRSRPYNFIRIEMPKFMWNDDRESAERAIDIALWQYELGGNKPLVLNAASERCDLSHDKWVVEQQMKAAFDKKKLDLIEFYDGN